MKIFFFFQAPSPRPPPLKQFCFQRIFVTASDAVGRVSVYIIVYFNVSKSRSL